MLNSLYISTLLLYCSSFNSLTTVFHSTGSFNSERKVAPFILNDASPKHEATIYLSAENSRTAFITKFFPNPSCPAIINFSGSSVAF